MQSIITNLTKLTKQITNSNKDIEDIILFGSVMKGKDKPKDIDILIIFKTKIDKSIESNLRKNSNLNLDINSITIKELEEENFIAKEGIYLEGYSLKNSIKISTKLGFHSVAFLKYDLSEIKGSQRVRFYYALNGRNKEKGFLSSINANKYSEEVILCDYSHIEKLKDFFNSWDVEYRITPSLIPLRLKDILLS